MTDFDWEPSYGFCAENKTNVVELAEALELVRRRACAYNMDIMNGDTPCDCKYGGSVKEKRSLGSERTGCPELREIINRLLHRPEIFNG